MVNPKILCTRHLLGEHVELHMFAGSLKRQKSIIGFIKNNCLQPNSIIQRHDELVIEMKSRNMNHKSDLINVDISYLPIEIQKYTVDGNKSLQDLIMRCDKCKQNWYNLLKNIKMNILQ